MQWTDIISMILSSNFPTLLSVLALIAGASFVYFYVLPRLDRLKELEEKEQSGEMESGDVAEALREIQHAVVTLAEAGPVDNLDFKEGVNNIYKAMQRFERQLTTIASDSRDGTAVQKEILNTLQDLHIEIASLKQRMQSLSSVVYQSTGTTGGALSDLRELR